MRVNKYISFFIYFLSLFLLHAQETNLRNDDLGDVSDEFQQNYFEALQQKGIENYERAIQVLLECKRLEPKNAAVYFELGKNYLKLENYFMAEESLIKANELHPNDQWILDYLYQLYDKTKNTNKVIETLKRLGDFHDKYKEELAEYYFRKGQYENAINQIDELDTLTGVTKKREWQRHQVYLYGKMYNEQVVYLLKKIHFKTASESDYVKLIFAYSQLKDDSKAFEVALQYANSYPNSDTPYLSLYKFYISNGKIDNAVSAMLRVAKSSSLSNNEKYKVVHDFLLFATNNKKYIPELEKAAKSFSHPTINSKIAAIYAANNNTEKATEFIDSFRERPPTNFEDFKLLGELLLKENKIDQALDISSKALELYPAQPIFYLQQAKAHNIKYQAKKALDSLFFGLDYLIDDSATEAMFYKEIAKSYSLLNKPKEQEKYLQKARKILN